VEPGEDVARRKLLARGVTHIYFQANIWIFTGLAFIVGILMGIGKAAVYKHIPTYFPKDVGVVGGIVGVLGGLGGFVSPIIFGYLLRGTGIWTTCWMYFFLIAVACLVWMHFVVRRMMAEKAPHLAEQIESPV
jgi:NNP family nitrate/nitrite transporter-like MFS transporter